MMLAAVALLVVLIVMVGVLLARGAAGGVSPDPRLQALPDAVVTLSAKLDATDAAFRSHIVELRREQAEAATQARQSAAQASRELREEVAASQERVAAALNGGLNAFKADHSAGAETLRGVVARDFNAMGERLNGFFAESGRHAMDARGELMQSLLALAEKNAAGHQELREALHRSLTAMGTDQREGGEKLRSTVEAGLHKLNTDNAAKLDEMRVVVDEKLEKTLNERLMASFGTVSDQLTKVHTGLGEMKELASGVSDLKKVFSNVKSRGIVGEFQLGMQLEQMFSREQYEVNVPIKPNSGERVEFALKIPDGDSGHVLLPIDAKFPREDWERLEHAYEHGTKDEQDKLGNAFERAIRTEGKRICEKYIDPPKTLPFGIMFLPTEALYAEVMRRPGLHTELQSSCNVTVAGPSSFMAILTSFQMGFRTLAIQKKGNEVWNVLGRVKKEFSTFELLMNKVERNVTTVQNTLNEIGTRTRVINKNLHNVGELHTPPDTVKSGLLSFDGGVAPLLAAMADDEEPRA